MDQKEKMRFFYYKNKNLNLAIQSYNCEILQKILLSKKDQNIFYKTEDFAPLKLRKILEALVILSSLECLDQEEIILFLKNLEYKDEIEKESRMTRTYFKYIKSSKYPKECKNINKEIFEKITIVSNNGEIHDGDSNFMMDYELWFEVVLFISKTIEALRDKKIENKTLQYYNFCFLDKITNNKINKNLFEEGNDFISSKSDFPLVKNNPSNPDIDKKEIIINFVEELFWGKYNADRFFELNEKSKNEGNKYLVKKIVENEHDEKYYLNSTISFLNNIYQNDSSYAKLKKVSTYNKNDWNKVFKIINSETNINDTKLFKTQEITFRFLNNLYYFISTLKKERNNNQEDFAIFNETLDGYTTNLKKKNKIRIETIKKMFINSSTENQITKKNINELSFIGLEKENDFLTEFKAIFLEYWYYFEKEKTLRDFVSNYKEIWNTNINNLDLNKEQETFLNIFFYYKKIVNGYVIQDHKINLPENSIRSWSAGIENYINIDFLQAQLEILKLKYRFMNLFVKKIQKGFNLINKKDYKDLILSDFSRINKTSLNKIFFVLPEIEEFKNEAEVFIKIKKLFLEENVFAGWIEWTNSINSKKGNSEKKYFTEKNISQIKLDFSSKTLLEDIIKQMGRFKNKFNNNHFSYKNELNNQCKTNKNLSFNPSSKNNDFEVFWTKYISTIENDYKKLELIINSKKVNSTLKQIIEVNKKIENLK